MGVLKTRKNKKFNYQPRYYQHDGEGSPFQMEHKFDKYRKTVGPSGGLKGKFHAAMDDLKSKQSRDVKLRLLVIVSILVFLFLYIIDFDLSIFS